MKVRIGGTRTGLSGECCSSKKCQKSLENKPLYHWNWFIQDAQSTFDGEEHRVTLCRECYEDLEKMFVNHVVSSNQVDSFIAYGGELSDLDNREKERLGTDYKKELEQKQQKIG